MSGRLGIPEYKITALNLGNIRLDKSSMTYQSGAGVLVDIPVWGAAVEGNGLKMLLDTGVSTPERWNPMHPVWQEKDETLEAALAELGWSSNDIDIVVNSHLHWDHCDNNWRLPNAHFYVSLAEWNYAQNPIENQKKLYQADFNCGALSVMNYVLINQDLFEIAPGIKTIETPGHSAGHQSTVVNTSEGIVCVAGDAACFMENLTTPTPPGGLTSAAQALDSIEKMTRIADRIFMNHDPDLQKFQDHGFPLVPKQATGPATRAPEAIPAASGPVV
jgi:N-acyl homoserine lactone hydrolase